MRYNHLARYWQKGKYMIKIKGNFAQAIIYADTLDKGSEGLIKTLCNSIIAENSKIRIMPDVHPGKGCAVGMTMTLDNKVAPGLVGVDIGCGTEAVKVKPKRLELQQLDKIVQSKIPSGMNIRQIPHRFAENAELNKLKCAKHIRIDRSLLGIGTLGGGNHFIELNKFENGYYLVIHSGSRHLGVEVERYYHELAYERTKDNVPYEFAYLEGELFDDYLHDMSIVQKFARLNRMAIADDICKSMKFAELETFSTIHNYIDTENKILRKGAISAQNGEKMIIPLNMRDGCLICKGMGNAEWNYSAPHGAGREYSRADTVNSFTLAQYKKEMKGIFSTSISRDTLDECPMAYKNPQTIIDLITPTAEITERLMPVYNYKSGVR